MRLKSKPGMPPLVSIISASYNTENFVGEMIESVVQQSFGDWELLVIDDASEDKTPSLVEAWKKRDSRIQLIQNTENLGAAQARNKGISAARGRFIAFLDSDDKWLPHKLHTQVQFMQTKGAAISYSDYLKINETGKVVGSFRAPAHADYGSLLRSNVIGCLTAMYDTSILGKRFMPDILKRQDYALWLSILRDGHIAYGINEALGCYRLRSNSLSANKIQAARYQWKVYREVEKLPLLFSVRLFFQYGLKGFRKHHT